jgi:nucleotide-binding universal stress UspA family protein
MEKKILIAVDGSFYTRKAIEYTVKMESSIKDLDFILLNIQPKISDFLIEDIVTDAKSRSALKDVLSKNEKQSLQILDKSKSIMAKLGIEEKRIETITQRVIRGTAKAILDCAKQSHCEAIVMGRRGVSRLAEAFTGSVTNNVLEHTAVTPVWAVGGKIKSSKIMVAVDGSEGSLRAVDHICRVVGGNPDIEMTLLHVAPRLRDYCTIDFEAEGDALEEIITQGDRRCLESFYTHAREKFERAGLKESQISIKQIKSKLNIGKRIIKEARKGDFGTVVIGRNGANNSFFIGSVSRHVLTSASDLAVWLVP